MSEITVHLNTKEDAHFIRSANHILKKYVKKVPKKLQEEFNDELVIRLILESYYQCNVKK